MSDGKTFSICGIEGFELDIIRESEMGGQHVGMPPTWIQITHKDLDIAATVRADRSQLKARDLAICMIATNLEYQRNFSDREIHMEAMRLTDKKYDNKPQSNEDKSYEF